jgi:hypothetical protein
VKPQTHLRFELGGFNADGIQLRLSRGQLHYSKTTGPFRTEPPHVLIPSEDQWRQFWQDVDRMDVWSWLPKYIDSDVLDGIEWSLSLSHDGRKVKCEGINAYPGSDPFECPNAGPFADLLRALAKLAGQPDITPSAP